MTGLDGDCRLDHRAGAVRRVLSGADTTLARTPPRITATGQRRTAQNIADPPQSHSGGRQSG